MSVFSPSTALERAEHAAIIRTLLRAGLTNKETWQTDVEDATRLMRMLMNGELSVDAGLEVFSKWVETGEMPP